MTELSRQLYRLLDRDALKNSLVSGARVLVAVSGGADSVALLLALHAYKLEVPARPIMLSAVHVNHNLRPESAQEAQFVSDLCQGLQIPLQVETLQLGEKPGNVSPEEHWRHHRYESFARAMTDTSAQYIALGHNLDDLAETFLYHLARGTGIHGLTFSFFKQSGDLPIIRPLWKTNRSSIEAALNAVGQAYLNDPSNQEIRYSRNRIRHEVMPALRSINPQAADAIFRASRAIGDCSNHHGSLLTSTELAISILKHNLSRAPANIHDFTRQLIGQSPSDRQVSQAFNMVSSHKTGTVSLGGNNTLVVTQDLLWIAPGDQLDQLQLAVAHCRHFHTVAAILEKPLILEEGTHTIKSITGNAIHFSTSRKVILRNRRPGDRIGGRLLKKNLIDCRVPWYLRDYLLLAEHNGEILQIIGDCPKLNDSLQRKHQQLLPVTVMS